MNRRKFALSWGRKIFFGVSWPLSLIFGLVYLRSFILPHSPADIFYFLLTYVGHFGVLNMIAFFLLYCPVVLMMPTYYVSRLWSLLLILFLNAFILIDAISFSSFHLHLNSFISPLLMKEGIHHLLGSDVILGLLGGGLFVVMIFIWVKGERTWRYMKGRFSNPVSNWYLYIILLFFIAGKIVFYYQPISPKLANVFPLNLIFEKGDNSFSDNRSFYYPSKGLDCRSKVNPSVIMLVLKEWSQEGFTSEMMPKTFHMKGHGTSYTSHINVSTEPEGGLFSLLYSLPSSYLPLAPRQEALFYQVLKKRNYEMVQIQKDQNLEKFQQWLTNRSGGEIKPFFLSIYLEQSLPQSDEAIDKVIMMLQHEDLLKNSYVVLTGAVSGPRSTNIPLLISSPERRPAEISHVTTPYDVIPSLMHELWNCNKVFETATVGEPLGKPERDWVLVTGEKGFKILDFKNNNVIQVENGNLTIFGNEPRFSLVFSALRTMTKFNRPN